MTGRRSLYAMLGFVLAYALAAALVRNSYYQLMLTLVLVWACFGLAWNVLSGYTGLVSFGHAAFFGLGAYTFIALGMLLGAMLLTRWVERIIGSDTSW